MPSLYQHHPHQAALKPCFIMRSRVHLVLCVGWVLISFGRDCSGSRCGRVCQLTAMTRHQKSAIRPRGLIEHVHRSDQEMNAIANLAGKLQTTKRHRMKLIQHAYRPSDPLAAQHLLIRPQGITFVVRTDDNHLPKINSKLAITPGEQVRSGSNQKSGPRLRCK